MTIQVEIMKKRHISWALPLLLSVAACEVEGDTDDVGIVELASTPSGGASGIDTSFGGDGVASVGKNVWRQVTEMAVLADERIVYADEYRIVLGGTFPIPLSPTWEVGRLKSNGAIDDDWNGGQPFYVHGYISGAVTSSPGSVIGLSDNKVMAVGTVKTDKTRGALVRFKKSGTPDTTFGVNGVILYDPPSGYTSMGFSWAKKKGSLYLIGGVAWKNGEAGDLNAKPYVIFLLVDEHGTEVTDGLIHGGFQARPLPVAYGKVRFDETTHNGSYHLWYGVTGENAAYHIVRDYLDSKDEYDFNKVERFEVPAKIGNWEPKLEDLTANRDRAILALSPEMGVMTVGDDDEPIGAFQVDGVTGVSARRVKYLPMVDRYALVGEGKKSTGQSRTVVILADAPDSHWKDQTFGADGDLIVDIADVTTEKLTAIAGAGSKFVIAAADAAASSAMARFRVAWGESGEPCWGTWTGFGGEEPDLECEANLVCGTANHLRACVAD
jgi:hypothetical protein